ncbi:hypothetical protein BSR59_14800 [Vibrio parahaemolyticus]|nr:hypothetical protein BSR59_14800 [Vibrio parahaemolyticus]
MHNHIKLKNLVTIYSVFSYTLLVKYNAFYTANSGLSRTLPHSFLTKEKQILALIFMKQIEK